MAERRTWTAHEDDALKALKDQRKIRKWSEISRLLEVEFNIFGRNGKQCRQRYHNHLDDHITRNKWSREENQILMDLHIKLGNRWASISRSLPGRTDNCVKNHFYSQFRKAIRIVNDLMKKCLKKCYKPIKPNFINKIIEITQSEHRKATMSEQFIEVAINLKEKVLRYSLGLVDEKDLENNAQIHEIIQLLSEFNRYYRQKYTSKKLKRKAASQEQVIPSQDKTDKQIVEQKIQVKLEEVQEQNDNCVNYFQGFNAEYLSLRGIGGFQENQDHNDSTDKHSQPSLIQISEIKHIESSNFLQFSQICHYEQDFNFQL